MGKWEDDQPIARIWRAAWMTGLMLAAVLIYCWCLGERLGRVEGHGSLSAEAIAVRAETGR